MAPSCLECPFDRCILEEGGVASARKQEWNEEIKELASKGVSISELAERYSLNIRTIQRVLSK